MWKHGRDESGAYYFALDREGRPIIAPYSMGSEFFAIMACAALYRATGEDLHKDAALASVANVLGRLENPKGQWNKRLAADRKRVAHDMHMARINVGLVLGECIDVPGLDDMVAESVELILNRFYRPEYGMVFENLNPDFSIDLDSCDGRLVCPGHALESAWFILKYAGARKRHDLAEKACALVKSVLEKGWDSEHGGIFYFLDALGRPSPNLDWDMKLWWVHAEALVAALSAYATDGDAEMLKWFRRIDEWTWRHFPDAQYGEWFGYLNRRGETTHLLKGGRWKTFFHLPRALMECIFILEKMNWK
jgi:N-acylglucosamine 2-epimerase